MRLTLDLSEVSAVLESREGIIFVVPHVFNGRFMLLRDLIVFRKIISLNDL